MSKLHPDANHPCTVVDPDNTVVKTGDKDRDAERVILVDLDGDPYEAGTSGPGGGTVDQGDAGADPWPVEFSAPQHVIVDSGAGGGGLTDTELRATPVPISGTVTASGPLTDTQLRNTPVPVSGTVATGALTDTQLRAVAVPVSGPLTDTQLRAVAVPVSGTVTASGPLTDTQLRATPVEIDGSGVTQPVSGSVTANAGTNLNTSLLALETGGVLEDIYTELLSKTEPANAQHTIVDSGSLTANAGTNLNTSALALESSLQSVLTELGAKTEPADTQITIGPADSVSAPVVLDALNEYAEVALSGYYGVSVTVVGTATSGTITFHTSYDGGTTVQASYVFNAVGQLVGTQAYSTYNGTASFTYPVVGGASHVRVTMSLYTSGSLSVTFRKTAAIGMQLPTSGLNTGAALATSSQIGGQWLDAGNLLVPIGLRSFGAAAVGDMGVVVKPINAATWPLFVKDVRAATPTVAQVADSATSVTLLASSATRLCAAIYNDSSAVLRVKLGATASATSFTILLPGNASGVGGYYEVPGNYTGIIDGIWSSAAGGNAYITSLVI